MSFVPSPTAYPPLAGLIEALWEAATTPSRRPVRRRESDIPGFNHTLRPGGNTPLWNSLVRMVLPLLKVRGTKANLARFLGLPRQRLNAFLVARSAMPDAERTLLLLIWITKRQQGKTLS